YFYVYENGDFNKFFIKGVNLGAAKPGYYPGEFGITKEDYKKWFEQISDMNANTIRVYTILMPEFYEAFLEFNKGRDKPLYLIHGLWINEEDISNYMDAFNPKLKNETIDEAKTLVDVINGNANIPFQ
ncbi:family 2 glycosyl transferase, partial [Vibrio parahaemolyticus]|nr:family 2 glycosyl transferase [Vibrio parahaemolyticus]